MSLFLQPDDFGKAIAKLRPAQRPLGWQKNPKQKIEGTLSQPYKPKPAHSITLSNGRKLTVPSAEDRIIQGAIHQALSRHIPTEAQGTHAIAAKLAQQLDVAKDCWILRCDIKEFFPSLGKQQVLQSLQEACPTLDAWTLQAIQAILTSSEKGLPQGSPLSPQLAELTMIKVDKELAKNNGTRYVDDILVITKTEKEARQQAKHLTELIAPLGLSLNPDKTSVTHYPDTPFSFLGSQYPAIPEQDILVKAPAGSVGLGLKPYHGEKSTFIVITQGGMTRKVSPSELKFSKEYFLRSLTDKPTLDSILLLASTQPQCSSKWGKRLFEQRDKFLSTNIAKPLHDAAFKLYVGKVKPKQAQAHPADAARVLQALIVGNELLRTGKFPDTFANSQDQYQQAMMGLQSENYEQYRQVVSSLFKENYQLRQKNNLPTASAYEESIVEHNHDLLEDENINLS